MKILGIMFLALFLWTFLFGKVKLNGNTDIGTLQRAGVCVIGSLVITLIVGLPVLGILFLVFH